MNFVLACIGAFSQGTVGAWTSPVLPYLTDCIEDHNQNLTEEEVKHYYELPIALDASAASWIGSLFPIGALISGQV
jgi:hypothetical protein